MRKQKSRSRARKNPNVVYGLGDKGQRVRVVLIPPSGKGKIDPKVIEAAVKKVRAERIKAQAGGR